MKDTRMNRGTAAGAVCLSVTLFTGLLLMFAGQLRAENPAATPGAGQTGADHGNAAADCSDLLKGSPFIPVDSWVYPAVLRLYSLGYVDTVFLGIRPWTRSNLDQFLEQAKANMGGSNDGSAEQEAEGLYQALIHAFPEDQQVPCRLRDGSSQIESVYSVARAISGTPLRDSFHLGSTIVNDFGRPYSNGFNNYTGASGFASAGRFVLYARGEFQGSPSAAGYSTALAQTLTTIDGTTFINPATGLPFNQATIPLGPISAVTHGRLLEAYVSGDYLNHEISFGKQDDWLGPGLGGAMAFSNNADNFYSFHINRIEPLAIPFLSRITGPFRYEFLVGSLKGHVYPNSPWVHVEKVSFKPTADLEFGFERSVIWGGKDHEPITLHTFLRSFFSTANVTDAIKNSSRDPGARFGAFDFTWRLPFARNWLTLYSDMEAHDDVSPISALHRAAYRPGLYLSQVPGIPRLDVRVEGISTDPPTSRSNGGQFNYYEDIQRQGYTNEGQIFGDWIGREAKGGQGWITYHLSGNEWIQVSARNQKTPKDFVPGGTTLNDISIQAVKRIRKEFELNGIFEYENWKAPVYLPGQQTVTTTTIQLTWYPERQVSY